MALRDMEIGMPILPLKESVIDGSPAVSKLYDLRSGTDVLVTGYLGRTDDVGTQKRHILRVCP
jgi:hypothetical protein